MNPTPNKAFSAARIAEAAGVSRQAVYKALADVEPAQCEAAKGGTVKLWTVGQLPESLRAKLVTAAHAGRWASVDCLLAGRNDKWQPAAPLAECAPGAVEQAGKLRDALANALTRWHDAQAQRQSWADAEIEGAGLADYQKAFGHEVTAKTFWRLFDRTLNRARGGWEFTQLEIYLDEAPARKAEAKPVDAADSGPLARLSQAVALVGNPAALAEGEDRAVWLAALECYTAQVELGTAERTAKETIFDFIMAHAPGLATSRNALRKGFDRRLARWQAAEYQTTALADQRGEANAARAKEISQDDLDVCIGHTVFACGGRVSQGIRECLQKRMVSEALASRILANPSTKSYVPTWLRDRVRHQVAMLDKLHHGERQTRDNGAWVERYWDCVPALDWWCADDCTLPVYFYVPDGQGWFTLMRGQFLLMIDARSTAALGYALMPERNYNALTIRTLITRCCDQYGLPGKGFYFENGIWKNSKILKGVEGDGALGWDQAEQGLREFGLHFHHAIRARSKPVERVLGAFQSYMERDPGYAGRDERRDGFEVFQKTKLAVEARRVDPRGRFYTMEQWETRLGEVCEQYNSAPQAGKHTGGLSPAVALAKHRPEAPPVRFDANIRYLLAGHKRPVRVGVNGITLRFGNQNFNYRSEQTGELRGQTVLAWFDPDEPGILTVTDMDRRNPFCVERSQAVPAMPGYVENHEELLAQELERAGSHMQYARTRYRILKPAYDQRFRANLVERETVERGQEIEAQKQDLRAGQRETQALQSKARKAYGRLGMNVDQHGDRRRLRPETVTAAQRLASLLAEDEPAAAAKENGSNHE